MGSGGDAVYGCGDDPACLPRVAWFGENAGGDSHPVARLAPNAYGLYDVWGNLWEWTADCYDAAAWGRYAPEATDPGIVDMSTCVARALRGGSFYLTSRDLRSSFRYWFVPSVENWNFGFRCVRGVRRQSPLVP